MFEQEIQVLKALANGVNYFTGEKCKDDSVLNDTDIIRTLYEVCDQLKNIIPEKIRKSEFVCPFDIEEKFEYEEEMNMTKIIDKISTLYPDMKKLKYTQISDILIQKGLLEKVVDKDGKNKTKATENANQYGIYNVQKTSMYGQTYQVVTYNKTGQKYILSILKNL